MKTQLIRFSPDGISGCFGVSRLRLMHRICSDGRFANSIFGLLLEGAGFTAYTDGKSGVYYIRKYGERFRLRVASRGRVRLAPSMNYGKGRAFTTPRDARATGYIIVFLDTISRGLELVAYVMDNATIDEMVEAGLLNSRLEGKAKPIELWLLQQMGFK